MISIIIPSFNQELYLPDAIESALNQTSKFDELEIIVVDDGSTDNSLAIAKRYEGMGVKVISQINKGLSSARNTGIMNAKGIYILPLDADDILLDTCIEKVLTKIKDTNADIVALSFKNFGLDNSEIILVGEPKIEDFKSANRIGYCSAIRKDALLAIGGYSPRMIWGAEDYALWFNLLSRGYKITTISEPLWLYRIKESSMWTETAKHQEEYMSQIRKDFPGVFNE